MRMRYLMGLAAVLSMLACSAVPGVEMPIDQTSLSDRSYVVVAAQIEAPAPVLMPAPAQPDVLATANPIEARMVTRLNPAVERYDSILTRTGVLYHLRL